MTINYDLENSNLDFRLFFSFPGRILLSTPLMILRYLRIQKTIQIPVELHKVMQFRTRKLVFVWDIGFRYFSYLFPRKSAESVNLDYLCDSGGILDKGENPKPIAIVKSLTPLDTIYHNLKDYLVPKRQHSNGCSILHGGLKKS